MDNKLTLPCDVEEVSDGYHTFRELYEHRVMLFAALMKAHGIATDATWKSKLHDDGTTFGPEWFVVGIKLPTGMVTYHVDVRYWGFFQCRELERAPKWDGHTSQDVVNRLMEWTCE